MIDSYINFIFEIGLLGFFIYMIIVGTFIPAPTQILLIPAGVLIAEGSMNFFPLLLVTALGTTIGATLNYFISKKYIAKLIPKKKLIKVKKIFNYYGDISVLLAPMMLGMGQYISLIAGVSRMKLIKFIPMIFISNFIFDGTMVSIGYFAGTDSRVPLLFLITGIVIIITTFYFKIKKDNVFK